MNKIKIKEIITRKLYVNNFGDSQYKSSKNKKIRVIYFFPNFHNQEKN